MRHNRAGGVVILSHLSVFSLSDCKQFSRLNPESDPNHSMWMLMIATAISDYIDHDRRTEKGNHSFGGFTWSNSKTSEIGKKTFGVEA